MKCGSDCLRKCVEMNASWRKTIQNSERTDIDENWIIFAVKCREVSALYLESII